MNLYLHLKLAFSMIVLVVCLVGCVAIESDADRFARIQAELLTRTTPEPSPTPIPTQPDGAVPEPSPTPIPTQPDGAVAEPSPTPAPTPERIIGGDEATPGAWPWQARLNIVTNDGTFLCGGSLIDTSWVLTAAHCFFDSRGGLVPPASVTVILGDHNRTVPEISEQTFNVTQIIVHPDFSEATMNRDIALLRLQTAARLDGQTQTIPLVISPDHDVISAPDVLATISGWGTTETGFTSNVLREAVVPLVAHATCNARGSYDGRITDSMLCAGFAAGGVDTCQGDSGGPLVVRDGANWRLAGITSWGWGCAQANLYGVYTRVSRFNAWITAHMGNAERNRIVAAHSGKCLDVAGGPNALPDGSPVQQWDCVGATQTNQLWTLVEVGDAFQIVAAHSGKCLDVTGGPDALANGSSVQQWDCLGAAQTNQLWRFRTLPVSTFSWAPQQPLGDRATRDAPALAVFGDRLYMAWRGLGEDNIWFSSFTPESGWGPQQMLEDRATKDAPALAAFGDRLYMAWRGLGEDNIWFSSFTPEWGWGPQQPLGDRATKDAPALAAFGDRLYMAWRGLGEDNIWFSSGR